MYSAVSQNLQFFEHNTTLSLILPLTDTYITYHLDISLRYYTYFLPYFSQKSRVGTFKLRFIVYSYNIGFIFPLLKYRSK